MERGLEIRKRFHDAVRRMSSLVARSSTVENVATAASNNP